MALVAKKDIEILTKQLLRDKLIVFETIGQNHVEIDPSLRNEIFLMEFKNKMCKIKQTKNDSNDMHHISIDEAEAITNRFDNLDKKLAEWKAPTTNVNTRKENHLKRYGSLAEINKTLSCPSSSQNLSTALTTTSDNVNNDFGSASKLSADDLIQHNSIKDEVQLYLDFNQNRKNFKSLLNEISQTYKASFDRLNRFFDEVRKVQCKTVEQKLNVSLFALDQELLLLMDNFIETLSKIRFTAENQNIYATEAIKTVESILSDDLTDILENFYKHVK